MKRLAILCLLLCACPSWATIAYVGGTAATNCVNFVTSITVSYSPVNGNTVHIHIGQANSVSDFSPVVTDSNSVSATRDSSVSDAGINMRTYWFRATNVSGSPISYTVSNLNGSGVYCVSVLEFSGEDGSSPLDQTSSANSNSGAFANNDWTGGAITSTVANEVILGGAMMDGSLTSAGANGYSTGSVGNNANVTGIIAYQIVSATGAYTGEGSRNNFSHFLATTISYKAASGGAPATQHNLLTLGAGIAKLDPDAYLPLLGVGEAIVSGLPPINARGENDGLRQDNAVIASVDALVRNSLLTRDDRDDGVYTDAKAFTLFYVHSANKFDLMGFSSPLVDWTQMVLRSDSLNGVVDWKKVSADLSDLVNFAAFSHWFDPRKATAEQMKSFLVDFAHIVDAYNRAE